LSKKRIDFLDGMRGLAALYVAIFHAFGEVRDNTVREFPQSINSFLNPFMYGNIGVDVFIVLSGFCLMLPILNAGGRYSSSELKSYFFRRAKRILPPYYAAWLLATIIVTIFPVIAATPGATWQGAKSPISNTVILSHLFLVHNLQMEWELNINGPLYSVATEWQIYFLLPLILLPLWHRYGIYGLLIVAGILGIIISASVPGIVGARPWLIELFALGMAAAIYYRVSKKYSIGRLKLLCTASWVTAWIAHILILRPTDFQVIIADYLVGIGTATGILLLCNANEVDASANRFNALGLFKSKPLMYIGMFSYSLYLCHMPIIAAVHALVWHLDFSPLESLVVEFVIGIPCALIFSYIFYWIFERPFLAKRPKNENEIVDKSYKIA